MKNCAILDKIKGSDCAVLGLGISNMPLIDFLLAHGARVTAYDRKTREELGERADKLEGLGVRLVLGEGYLDDVRENIIFRSPGIRPDAGSLPRAVARGAVITSEMELFLALTDAAVFAVTGSDGKTTTTTLTYLMLSAQKKREGKGSVYVGGNIGAPLLPHVESMSTDDCAVLELSSFQLTGIGVYPDYAAVTNISPNHLNWHTDMEEYISAKKNICGKNTALIVLNADNNITSNLDFGDERLTAYFSSRKASYGETVPPGKRNALAVFERDGFITVSDGERENSVLRTSEIKIPGRHNVENYMTAIALTYGRVDSDIYTEIARSFGGVEHRLEYIGRYGGADYYNSSIDSSPTRTAAALSALPKKPIVICGGCDKHIPFEPLALSLCRMAKAVVLNGATADKIERAVLECPEYASSSLTVIKTADLRSATEAARKTAKRGDIVLLSPACASFDQFPNFEERGKFFKSLVRGFASDEN